MIRIRMLALAALACLPLAAKAAVAQKPGLWSVIILQKIDPDLIAQMKQMGLQPPVLPPIEYEVCLTPEQVAKNALPDVTDPSSGCGAKNVKRSGDSLTGDLECHGQLEGAGKVKINLTGPESYTGESEFEGASREGFPVNMTSTLSGKWKTANCGSVKPLGS